MSEIDLKICILSVIIAAIFVAVSLLLGVAYGFIRDVVLVRKAKKDAARKRNKAQLRRLKEREARRAHQDDEFSRGIWEIMNGSK